MGRDASGFRISSRWDVGSGPKEGVGTCSGAAVVKSLCESGPPEDTFWKNRSRILGAGLRNRFSTLGSIMILMPPYCLRWGNPLNKWSSPSEWKQRSSIRHHWIRPAVHTVRDVLALSAAVKTGLDPQQSVTFPACHPAGCETELNLE